MKISYHASQEQFSPSQLLHYAQLAGGAGFDAIHSSDHFQPWSKAQGESGHTFSWLGAAMQACTLPFGFIFAPGQRHHPALVAQAIATLAELFPDRLWVALGSGEAINERVTGDGWPSKAVRNERLLECVHIMQRLLDGETVSHTGHVTVEEAKLYTLPQKRPLFFGAAITEETAHWMGGWAEGLLTINHSLDKLRAVISRFREGGGHGKPVYVKVQLSYARSAADASSGAFEQWKTNVLDSSVLAALWTPQQFEAAAKFVTPDDVKQSVYISSDLQQHTEWLTAYQALGVDNLILHNVNKQQEAFIADFGANVLPHFVGSKML